MSQQPAVLMVSHQRTMRHLIEQVCRQAGAQTVAATSGQKGSAIAAVLVCGSTAIVTIMLSKGGEVYAQ
jgi:CheY-like chemotaxis protein